MRNRRVHLAIAVMAAVIGFAAPAAAERARVFAWECAACNLKFESKAEKARHEISVHGAEGCEKCGVLYSDLGDSDAYAILHHDARVCLACEATFEDAEQAHQHLVAHHGLIRCGKCERVLEGEAEAAEHARECVAPQDAGAQ